MVNSQFNSPNSSNILKQIITSLIKTIEIEETALANILNLEKEMILKAKTNSVNLEEFVSLNESVNNILQNITKVQMITQIKLQFIAEFFQKITNFEENEDMEE